MTYCSMRCDIEMKYVVGVIDRLHIRYDTATFSYNLIFMIEWNSALIMTNINHKTFLNNMSMMPVCFQWIFSLRVIIQTARRIDHHM